MRVYAFINIELGKLFAFNIHCAYNNGSMLEMLLFVAFRMV